MKICIVGAGAIGAYFGLELALGGAEVSLIARGPHLAAMQADGVRVRAGGEERRAQIRATDDPAELGPQDAVIITLKAHSVPGICERLQPLLGPETAVVTASNGIPWWYFHKLEGPYEGRRIAAVDPGDIQWDLIGPARHRLRHLRGGRDRRARRDRGFRPSQPEAPALRRAGRDA